MPDGGVGDVQSPETEDPTGGRRVSGIPLASVLAVGGLAGLSAAAAAYEIGPATVISPIMDGLGVGPTAAGWLVSIMFATAVAASIPVGIWIDRVGPRRATMAGAAALLLAGAWGYVAAVGGSYWWLMTSRVLGGLAYVVLWNAGANLAARVVPPARAATAVGLFTASAPLGFAVGQFGGPIVAAAAGWPMLFPAFAGLGAVGGLLFWAATRGGMPGEGGTDADDGGLDRAALGRVLTDRAVWTVCGVGFVAFSLYLFLNSWMPTYLTESGDLTRAQAGTLVAVLPAVGIASRSLSGPISDRGFGGRRRPVLVGSLAIATPVAVGFVLPIGLVGVLALLVASGFFLQLAFSLGFTHVRELVDPTVAATAISMLTAVSLLGGVLAPAAGGAILEVTGSLTLAFVAAGALGLVGVGLAWAAPEP